MADVGDSSIEEKQIHNDSPVSLEDKEEEVVLVQTKKCGGFDIDEFCETHLICQQCNKRYKDPVTLPCLHSFCNECLNQCIEKQIPSFSVAPENQPLEEQHEIPVVQHGIPVVQHETPVVQHEIPVVQHEIPVVQDGIPVVQDGMASGIVVPIEVPVIREEIPNHEHQVEEIVSSTVSRLPVSQLSPHLEPSRRNEGSRSLSQIIDGNGQEGDEQEIRQEVKQEDIEEEEVQEKESNEEDDKQKEKISAFVTKENYLQYVPHIQDVRHPNENFKCQQGGCSLSLQKGSLPQVNQSLSNLVQTAQLKEDLSRGQVKCQDCVDKPIAEWICTDKKCDNKPLCNDCHFIHKKRTETTDHIVVKVDPEKEDWWRDLNRLTWFCPKHKDRRVDVYCITHNQLICERCGSLDGHSKCSKKDVDEVYDEEREQLQVKLQQLEELKSKFEGAIQNGEKVIENLIEKRDNTIKALEKHCDLFVKPLIAEKNRLIEKTTNICELKTKEINDHQEALKRVTDTLTDSLKFMNDYSQEAIPSEFMFLKSQFDLRVSDLFEHYDNFDLLPADNDEIVYRPNDVSLSPFMLGDVYSTACVKEFAFLKPYLPQDQLLLYGTSYKFSLECRDIVQTHVSLRKMPEIEAYVCPSCIDFNPSSRHCVKCNVESHSGQGKYTITIPPLQTVGQHDLHIYCPRPYPQKQYYVKKCPLSVYVALPTPM